MLRRASIGVVVTACVSLFCTVAGAQTLADHVPADAMLYVGWQGSAQLGPQYDSSRLKTVVDASNFAQLVSDFLPRLLDKIGREDADSAPVVALVRAIGPSLWRHPSAIYFGGIDTSNPQLPVPRVAVLCDAGAADAPSLTESLGNAVAQLPPLPWPIQTTNYNGLVAVTIGRWDAFDSLLGAPAAAAPAARLSDKDEFKQALAQVQHAPVVIGYADTEAVLGMIGTMIQMQGDEQALARWTKVRDALGLDGLHRIIVTGGFDGRDWSMQAFVAAPRPRRGVLSLMGDQPLTDSALRTVPKTATIVSVSQLDLSRLFHEVRDVVGDVDPDAQRELDQVVAGASAAVGLDLDREVFAALGDQWTFYVDPAVGGAGMVAGVLQNHLRDAAKARASLQKLEQVANQAMAGNAGRQGPTVQFRQVQSQGLSIHYLGIPMIAPAWTIDGDTLYVAMWPQTVAAAPGAAGAQQGSILDNPDYQALRKRLGGDSASAVEYYDLPRLAPAGYQVWLYMMQMGLGFADLYGIESPAMVLPPLPQVMSQLTPSGSVAWADDAGFHVKTITPFPLANTLILDNSMAMMQLPLAVSILLPSLNKARESANRVKCGSNLRQIGQGMLLYANDHGGSYPPDLGSLITAEQLSVETLVCPSSEDSVPPDVLNGTPEQRAAWANQHSSYEYLGTGMANDQRQDQVLAYEKPGNHGSVGMNLLFGDGHVEWMLMPQAQAEIARSKAVQQAKQNQQRKQP